MCLRVQPKRSKVGYPHAQQSLKRMNGHVPRKILHLPIFMPPRGFLPSRPAHKNPSPRGRDLENFNLLSRASYGAEKLLHRRKMFLWVIPGDPYPSARSCACVGARTGRGWGGPEDRVGQISGRCPCALRSCPSGLSSRGQVVCCNKGQAAQECCRGLGLPHHSPWGPYSSPVGYLRGKFAVLPAHIP